MLPLVAALAGGPTAEPAPAGPPRPAMKRKTAAGMIIGGTAVLGLSYGASTLASAVVLDNTSNRDQFRWAVSMGVPVVGPFRAAALPQSKSDRAATLTTGVLQAGGVALIVGGAVATARHARADQWDYAYGRQTPYPHFNCGKMFATGGALTLGAYIVTMAFGASRLSDAKNSPEKFDDPERSRAFGRRMMVPVVGGFLAMPKAGSYTRAWGAGLASMFQVTGLTTAIVAGVLDRREEDRRRAHVSAMPTRDGAQVTISMRF